MLYLLMNACSVVNRKRAPAVIHPRTLQIAPLACRWGRLLPNTQTTNSKLATPIRATAPHLHTRSKDKIASGYGANAACINILSLLIRSHGVPCHGVQQQVHGLQKLWPLLLVMRALQHTLVNYEPKSTVR